MTRPPKIDEDFDGWYAHTMRQIKFLYWLLIPMEIITIVVLIKQGMPQLIFGPIVALLVVIGSRYMIALKDRGLF